MITKTGGAATTPGHPLVDPVDGKAGGAEPDRGVADLAGVRAQAALVQTWKLSTDPQFIDKVRDVVGLYLDPPQAALVLCVDEKSQIQALDRTAPSLPILPTTPARRTHDYVRNGTSACSPRWMWPQAR